MWTTKISKFSVTRLEKIRETDKKKLSNFEKLGYFNNKIHNVSHKKK